MKDFGSSDGANVGNAGRILFCDDVLQDTCRMDRMGRNAVAVVADALAAKVHDPLSCHGSSAGPASRDHPPAGMALARGDPEPSVELTRALP